VVKWLRTSQTIMFTLSNKTMQVCFKDHVEIIIPNEEEYLIYINNKGEKSYYLLFEALYNPNLEITKRLIYIRDNLINLKKKNLQCRNQK